MIQNQEDAEIAMHLAIAWGKEPIKSVICLRDLPMPPSINACYANNPKAGRGRFKTAAYDFFIKEMMYWRLKNLASVNSAKAILHGLTPGQAIRVEHMFCFERHRIMTKSGRPKKNDTANRIKPLDDQLAFILGIDDCLFWAGTYDKIGLNKEMKSPYRESVTTTLTIIDAER